MKTKTLILPFIFISLLVAVETSCGTTFYSKETREQKPRVTYEKDTANIPEGKMISGLLPLLYGGGEHLEYDISYSGGIKLGEAVIDIVDIDAEKNIFDLRVSVSSENGALSWAYPVKDLHVTRVEGDERLPIEHESWQKEGRGYKAHKVTIFDQKDGVVTYTRNDGKPTVYQIDGSTHNEFSSFLSSRLMPFVQGQPFYVPTWADKKRVKVVVEVGKISTEDETIFGKVTTREIMPILTFSGTYDQRGDTKVWYTDDECRIPVKVNSKIIIGSLTATLKAWHNPQCTKYTAVERAD